QNVARAIKSKSVIGVEPHSGHDLSVDGREARVIRLKGVGLKGMALARVGHLSDDIAGIGRSGFSANSRVLCVLCGLKLLSYGISTLPGFERTSACISSSFPQ